MSGQRKWEPGVCSEETPEETAVRAPGVCCARAWVVVLSLTGFSLLRPDVDWFVIVCDYLPAQRVIEEALIMREKGTLRVRAHPAYPHTHPQLLCLSFRFVRKCR